MQDTLLLGGGGSDGVFSGGSMSTLSREENDMVMSSEESSSYPDESQLELGLGLSLGGGGAGKARVKPPAAAAGGGSWDKYARILTAIDFPTGVSTKAASSSSSSSSVTNANNTNGSCGTKRTAEPPSSPPGRSAVSQVVGWPPIRTYRMNSLTNHAKSPVTEDFFSTAEKCKSKNIVADKTNRSGNMNNNSTKERGLVKTSLFVKVNMDGIPIGRKVDLNSHSSYENLARAMDDMFRPNAAVGARLEEQAVVGGTRQPLRLLDGSSDFVLTYEDKEGDWMLVGDVPWEMFFNSVRRIRIMRTAEANGLDTYPSLYCRTSLQTLYIVCLNALLIPPPSSSFLLCCFFWLQLRDLMKGTLNNEQN